jgi:hypothetical protein
MRLSTTSAMRLLHRAARVGAAVSARSYRHDPVLKRGMRDLPGQPPYAREMPWLPSTRRVVATLVLLSGAALLAACSSGGSGSSDQTTTSTTASSSASGSASSGKATTTTTGATSPTLVPQTATSTGFFSPSKNISCEIDNNFGSTMTTQALCLTFSPAQSAVLDTDNTVTTCSGQQCLSNAGDNTPTLHYGQSITLGPFTCASSTTGMRCALASGSGFFISSSGIRAVGSATITSTTTTTSATTTTG